MEDTTKETAFNYLTELKAKLLTSTTDEKEKEDLLIDLIDNNFHEDVEGYVEEIKNVISECGIEHIFEKLAKLD